MTVSKLLCLTTLFLDHIISILADYETQNREQPVCQGISGGNAKQVELRLAFGRRFKFQKSIFVHFRDVGYPPDLSDCRGNVFEFPLGSGQRFYPPSLGVLNGVSQVQGFHGLAYLPPYPPPPPEWWFMQYLPRRTTGQHSCTGFNNVTHVTNCTNRTNDRLEPPEED